MRVLFLGRQDNSNVGWSMSEAARSVGIHADGWCELYNPLEYPSRFPKSTSIIDLSSYDILHFYNSRVTPPVDKPCVVQHGDSAAIKNGGVKVDGSEGLARAINIVETANLLRLVPQPSYFISPAVDVDFLIPRRREGPLRVGHFPTVAGNKGSPMFKEVLRELMDKFTFIDGALGSDEIRPWPDNMARLARCDIYLDQHSPGVCGEHGITCKEAAALGCIVLTNSFCPQVYEAAYGTPGYVVCNTREEFKQRLDELLSSTREEVTRLQQATREWVVSKHSYAATGTRLKAIYERLLS